MSGDAEGEAQSLEAKIARTRSRLSEDVDALAYKLSPDRLKRVVEQQTEKALTNAQEAIMDSVQGVTDRVGQQTQRAGQGFFDMINRHPLPTALIGAGIVLLAAGGGVGLRGSGRDDDDYVSYGGSHSYGEGDTTGYVRPGFSGEGSAGSGYNAAYDSAGGYSAAYDAGGAGYSAGYGGSDVYGSAGQSSREQARGQARDVGRGLTDFIESQPLVAGLLTAALGALVGLALPGTRREDELLGGARDRLAGQAREAAERAREAAQRTFDEVKETAKQEFGRIGEEVRAEGEKVVREGQEAAQKVADTAKETAKNEAKGKS